MGTADPQIPLIRTSTSTDIMAILMCVNWKLSSAPLKLYWFTNPKISLIQTGLSPILFGLVRVHRTNFSEFESFAKFSTLKN